MITVGVSGGWSHVLGREQGRGHWGGSAKDDGLL